MFYVYFLMDPRNDKPYYIGKGKRDRWQTHFRAFQLEHDLNKRKTNKIRSIMADGYEPRKYVRFVKFDTESEAFAYEQESILAIGLPDLCNLTLGDEGISGYHHSQEFKDHMRKFMTGVKKPEGTGAKIRAAKKGVPLSEAHKKALSGRTFTAEHKLKLSLSHVGKYHGVPIV